MRSALRLGLVLLLVVSALAQTGAKKTLRFDVVSIKQNRSGEELGFVQVSDAGDQVNVVNSPMYRIVEFAFNFKRNDLVLGAPEWARTERWDVAAKVAPEELTAFRAMTFVEQTAMLRQMLEERCAMQAHVTKKEAPVYAVLVGKGGSRMRVAQDSSKKEGWDLTQKPGEIHGRGVPMDALMYSLSKVGLDRQVVDWTQLKGRYDFDLVWKPETEAGSDAGVAEDDRASIFTAIQEQLGLRLEATKAQVDALVIERIERPTDN